MMTLTELNAIKERVLAKSLNRRDASPEDIKIVVRMATCGVNAGAREVLNAFTEEVEKRGLKNVLVLQSGCCGDCSVEPVCVEVIIPGREVVTYAKVQPSMAAEIVSEHIVNGNVVSDNITREEIK